MKQIKYTPDAADKLRALKSAISQKYGADKAKKIIKSITNKQTSCNEQNVCFTMLNQILSVKML